MGQQLDAPYQDLEIIEERITRKASGLAISRLLQMDNISHLEQELAILQKECELCKRGIAHMIHMKGD